LGSTRRADSDIDRLIEEITVDAYNTDEQLMGFENAFDEEAAFPFVGTVVGVEVEVLSVSIGNHRGELIASCMRDGTNYEVALLDIAVRADSATTRLIAAYRRWLEFAY
jgi:hypothetical protein